MVQLGDLRNLPGTPVHLVTPKLGPASLDMEMLAMRMSQRDGIDFKIFIGKVTDCLPFLDFFLIW